MFYFTATNVGVETLMENGELQMDAVILALATVAKYVVDVVLTRFMCFAVNKLNLKHCSNFIIFYCFRIFFKDGCLSSPCLNNGNCKTDYIGNYICSCAKGYFGLNCQYCMLI